MSAVVVDFDLNALIREVMAEETTADPRDIAKQVALRIPDAHLRTALEVALVHNVRVVTHARRYNIRSAAKSDSDDKTPPPRGPSRFDGVGQIYLRFLQEHVSVAGIWKFRGDCTRDDVLTIADFRMGQAKAVATEARREQLLATAMKEQGADTVSDLPEAVVLEVLRWQP